MFDTSVLLSVAGWCSLALHDLGNVGQAFLARIDALDVARFVVLCIAVTVGMLHATTWARRERGVLVRTAGYK